MATSSTTTTHPAPPGSGFRHSRQTWALWGTAAGVLGMAGTMFTQPVITEEGRATGLAVMDLLGRGYYHAGALTGLLAVGCLLAYAAGWQRLTSRTAPDSIAARIVSLGLTASAGALIVAYGIKGQLAVYLEGGINQNDYGPEALYTYFLIDDLAAFFGWWGATVAAAAVVWLAFREHVVARWIGALSALVALAPIAMLSVTGLTGFSGVVSGPWLIITGLGLAFARPRVPAADNAT